MSLQPGDLLANRYRLERPLGAGGMGVVWQALDIKSRGRVALKVLRSGRGVTPAMHKRLILEARAAEVIQHPNIIRVFETISAPDGTPVIVMELLRGLSLGEILEGGGRLSPRKTSEILAPVVAAIAAAHDHGIVHRDLKPANIFRIRDGNRRGVRVLDFGIAKLHDRVLGDETAVVTADGIVLGTLEYMAPEQLMKGNNTDHRVDVWALGAIAYECLTGRRAIVADGPAEAITAMRRGVPSVARVAPHVPPELASTVDRMLSLDPARRPSLPTVAAVLARCLSKIPPTRIAKAVSPLNRQWLRIAAAIALPSAIFWSGFLFGKCSADPSVELNSAEQAPRKSKRPRRTESVVAYAVPTDE